MFNVKLCALVASGAFAASAVLGFIGGADLFSILLRALVFGAFGFGFVAGASVLIARFLPELTGNASDEYGEDAADAADSDASERVGSTVDVSIGDDEELAPYAAEAGGADAENLAPAALDQGREGGYTNEERPSAPAVAAARPPELVGEVDVLPDLEGLSDSFISPIAVEGGEGRDEGRQPSSSGGASSGDGKFDAKEMAMAIQTILKRDEKG